MQKKTTFCISTNYFMLFIGCNKRSTKNNLNKIMKMNLIFLKQMEKNL